MRLRARAILGVCLALVIAGAAAEVSFLPRPVPKPAAPLKDSGPRVMAQVELEGLLARAARSLEPELRSRLAEAVLLESARAGYDPLFVLALVSVESRFRLTVSSDRGASGLMQLKPSTFAWISAREPDVGGDDYATGEDPVVDVRLAIRYFRWLERRFRSRDEALMAYNAGPKRLKQYKRADEIPDSLRAYPRKIRREYERLVKMAAGERDPRLVLARAN